MMMGNDLTGFVACVLMIVAMICVIGMFKDGKHFAAMRGHCIFGVCGSGHDNAAK